MRIYSLKQTNIQKIFILKPLHTAKLSLQYKKKPSGDEASDGATSKEEIEKEFLVMKNQNKGYMKKSNSRIY